jgi:membrane-bound metal-dependent hydrolase YbcI (DUF457 family)
MPSPLIHTTAGYVLYRLTRPRGSDRRSGLFSRISSPKLLAAAIGYSLLPDLDSVPGLLTGDMARYHNNMAHSLAAAVLVGLATGLIARVGFKASFKTWFVLSAVPYALHMLMDFFTVSRGVMLAWPLTDARFLAPFTLFYGLRWSEGLVSEHHVMTLVTELPVVVISVLLVHRISTRRRSEAPAASRAASGRRLLATKGAR